MSKFCTVKKIEEEIESIKKQMTPYLDADYCKNVKCDSENDMVAANLLKRTANLENNINNSIKTLEDNNSDIYVKDPKQYIESLKKLLHTAKNLKHAANLINNFEMMIQNGQKNPDISILLNVFLGTHTKSTNKNQQANNVNNTANKHANTGKNVTNSTQTDNTNVKKENVDKANNFDINNQAKTENTANVDKTNTNVNINKGTTNNAANDQVFKASKIEDEKVDNKNNTAENANNNVADTNANIATKKEDEKVNPDEINDKTKIYFTINDELIFKGNLLKKLLNKIQYKAINIFKGKNNKVFKERALILCAQVDKLIQKKHEISIEDYNFVLNNLNKACKLLKAAEEKSLTNLCENDIKTAKICLIKKLYKEAYIENAKACKCFNNKDYETAYYLFEKALDKYTRIGDEKLIAITTQNKEKSYYNWQTNVADSYIKKALSYAEDENFTSAFYYLEQAYNIYLKINNKNGVDSYRKSYELIKKKKQAMIERENRYGDQYKKEGNQYYKNRDYKKAINSYDYAAQKYHKAENYSAEKSCINDMGDCYRILGNQCYNNCDYEDAIDNYEYASAKYHQAGNDNDEEGCKDDIDDCYYELGNRYLKWAIEYADQNDFNSAEKYYEKAEDTYFKGRYNRGFENCRKQKKLIYIKHGNFLYNKGLEEYELDRCESAKEYIDAARDYFYKGDSDEDVYHCDKKIDEINKYIQDKKEREEYEQGVDEFNRGVDLYNRGDYSGAKSAFIAASNRGVDASDCAEYIKDCEEEINSY